MSRLLSKSLEPSKADEQEKAGQDNKPKHRSPIPRRSCNGHERDDFKFKPMSDTTLSIVVLGASGDLAKKKTYPALFALYDKGFLPARLQVIGYARTKMDDKELHTRIRKFLKGDESKMDKFLSSCSYVSGEYDTDDGYQNLNTMLEKWEKEQGKGGSKACIGRLFYLALPPTTYPQVCGQLRKNCDTVDGHEIDASSWVRIIIEKPFGQDLESSEDLADQIGAMFPEEQIYRIDHYLGKELVQNMLVLRFANTLFTSWWNRHYIANIQISFKEPFGCEGRGGYFDKYGIIRDVIQNHLMQVLALMGMEPPVSLHPDDVRDEKVKVLRCISAVQPEDCVLGQYTKSKDGNEQGYLDDPTVPKDSKTPTYAAVRLRIHNERWEGVPIIIKAGKALNERLAIIRIQLKTPAASIFGKLSEFRNELVVKFQPGEAIYAKMVVKKPGLEMDLDMSELDLTYPERYKDVVIPDAYERLILDCIRGDQQHFVRRDELRAAWAIFTPLLHAIDAGKVPCEPYAYGTRGPAAVDEFTTKCDYIKTKYAWKPKNDVPKL